MTAPGIIDVHTHVVPDGFPSNPSPDDNRHWPCLCHRGAGTATIEIGGRPFRELDSRSWQTARRLEDMDRRGIAAQALSPMPELLSYWFPPADGLAMARHVNDHIANMVAARPERFFGLGMVPLQDVELACRELSRLRTDGFAGVELGSNVNGAYLGEARFDPFWTEAEALGMAVFVHALHPVGADRLAAFPELVPFAAFALDTGLSAMTLVRAGVAERHPDLRLGFSHGGGALAPLACRLEQGFRVTSGFDGALARPPLETVQGFFLDSLVYNAAYLDYLARDVAPGNVFAGSDYPYAIEESDLAGFIARSQVCDAPIVNAAATRFLGRPGG